MKLQGNPKREKRSAFLNSKLKFCSSDKVQLDEILPPYIFPRTPQIVQKRIFRASQSLSNKLQCPPGGCEFIC